MSNSPNSELVTDALLMAFQRRRPDRRVVHHSDRGAAYTSLAFSERVDALELDQSFGSTGDCYDNAPVEAFWATLKRELAWIHGRQPGLVATNSGLRSSTTSKASTTRIASNAGWPIKAPPTTNNTQPLETQCPRNRDNSSSDEVSFGARVRCARSVCSGRDVRRASHAASLFAASRICLSWCRFCFMRV